MGIKANYEGDHLQYGDAMFFAHIAPYKGAPKAEWRWIVKTKWYHTRTLEKRLDNNGNFRSYVFIMVEYISIDGVYVCRLHAIWNTNHGPKN